MATITLDRRERNGEVWLTGPQPLDLALDSADQETLIERLRHEIEAALDAGADSVSWESDGPQAQVDEVAAAVGLTLRRDIHRLERALPLADSHDPPLPIRAFRAGTGDEAAWVRCNNRSFADHPDQGRETIASLHAAMAEPWFDHRGFLLLDGDTPVDDGGEIDGFCWTKVHPPVAAREEAVGEIYVIGVDPRAAGQGLGSRLVVAGLDHLAREGLSRALLYVDADNQPARRMYDRLGFTVASTRRVRSTEPARLSG